MDFFFAWTSFDRENNLASVASISVILSACAVCIGFHHRHSLNHIRDNEYIVIFWEI